jgi:hypothetical protein
VPGSRSSAAALSLALALAACQKRDVETKPFHVEVARSDAGSFLLDARAAFRFSGTGALLEPTVLRVAGVVPEGGGAPFDVTLSFRKDATGGLAFPAQFDGAQLTVTLLSDPASKGPEGEPLHYPGFRIETTGVLASDVRQFGLVESAYEGAGGTDAILLGPLEIRVRDDWTEFEPAECGPVYYDFLEVTGDDEVINLSRGERGDLTIAAPDPERWTVLHALSWHRRGTCGSQAEAWTQFAAWR